MNNGLSFVEDSISSEGGLALGEAYAPGSRFLGAAAVDRTTKKLTLLHTPSSPQSQVVSIVGDSEWIAWVEGSQQPTLADWTLYSYSRSSRRVLKLASAPKPDGIHYPNTAYVLLSMSRGTIVWSAIEGTDSIYHVYSIDADGTHLQTIAANAGGPQIVWPWVMYVTRASQQGAPATLEMRNLQSGQTQEIIGPSGLVYFAFDGTSVAWITSDTTNLYVMTTINGPTFHVASGRYLQFVSLSGRLIGWGQDKGAFAYDRKLKITVQLNDLYDFYPALNDQALDWVVQPDPHASNQFANTFEDMVNIRDLP